MNLFSGSRNAGVLDGLKLRGMLLSNRLTISPMCQYKADNQGVFTPSLIAHYLEMSTSGASAITIESTAVQENGRITTSDLMLVNDQTTDSFGDLIRRIRDRSDAKVGVQLNHAGRKTRLTGMQDLVAPSVGYYTHGSKPTKSMTDEEIKDVSESFVSAALRAAVAGIDYVEIHIAHGYLLHQFFSPLTNLRYDGYGGSLHKRTRLMVEICSEIRRRLPKLVIGARITGNDCLDNGIQESDALFLVEKLKNSGIDYVCVSSGGIIPITNRQDVALFNTKFSKFIKEHNDIPVRVSGGITHQSHVEKVLSESRADFIAIGRAYLKDPMMVAKLLKARN